MPKGDPDDNESVPHFARAVLAAEPTAIGGPISIFESGNTIVRAFIEAGGWALAAIAILLWVALRRFGDVAVHAGTALARRRGDAGDLRR